MKTLIMFLVCATGLAGAAPATDWTTFYERSDGLRTPDYEQTIAYCERLAEASPWIHYTTFGTSPRGRDLPLLIVDREGRFGAGQAQADGDVVCLVQAGIHSGEIDGKDAGLMLVRDIAITREREELLDGVTLLFIPIFNVDGHERSGPYNRPNQDGPEEMGWRVTAQNLNLNRDYLKADAPEMQAWLRLYNAWLPEFFVDCHVTDGADYRYVVTWAAEIYGTLDDDLTDWLSRRFAAPLQSRLEADGVPVAPYQWYRRHGDPRSGLRSWVASPRLSEGYVAEHNRPGLLIETHSLKDYRTRVQGTYTALVHTLDILSHEHDALRRLTAAADRHTASPAFRDEPFPIRYALDETDSVMIPFEGFEYETVQSPVSGGTWRRYSDVPVTFDIPYFNRQRVEETVELPAAYIVPPEWIDVIERLELHGVRVERLDSARTLPVEVYRFHGARWEEAPYEGRHRASVEVEAEERTVTFPPGSALVDMNQRAARLAAQILEPRAPDSYVSWGFFDAVFERKEYIEGYVIEPLAQRMLAGDAALAREFETWREEHPDAGPGEIRTWFHRRTPYYDTQHNVYPVGRVLDPGAVSRLRSGQ